MDTQPLVLENGVRMVRAANPSAMTLSGTNTYIIGTGDVAVIDPGPTLPSHFKAILAALAPGERVSHIFVTHAHLDHSPLARPLAEATGAQVLAFGPPTAGRSAVMTALAKTGLSSGGEGVDHGFTPDIRLTNGEAVAHGDWSLTALHTPGHFCNHLCFQWRDIVFSGDHVMGWASTLISPPDGDLSDYLASLAYLRTVSARVFYSGHGDPIGHPNQRLDDLIRHRQGRTAQILDALTHGPATPADLTARIYTDTPKALMAAARRNVFAHLIDLTLKNQITADGEFTENTLFSRR
ncbi:MBL fold metallo-hydrolase [Phaeovulum sp.]|uniref:MBL fold metallo-hydrolase n=1 Tax=Phaeovulum sp. TaxID=2934796 RepID=UPI0039E6ADE3